MARGKYKFFVYSAITFDLLHIFPSAVKLSALLNVSGPFAIQIAKLILTSEYKAVNYYDYIISSTSRDSYFLSTNLKLLQLKKGAPVNKNRTRNITLYGFNPSTNEYRT